MSYEPAAGDLLIPLPPVQVGSVTVHVDESRPVAAIVAADGTVRFVTWPDAPLPPLSTQASAFPVDGAFWVIYVEDTDDDPGSGTPRTVALRVALDGTWSTVDAGELTVIGVAVDGLWATPTPTVTLDDDGADDLLADDVGDFAEGPIAGIDYDEDAPIERLEDLDREAASPYDEPDDPYDEPDDEPDVEWDDEAVEDDSDDDADRESDEVDGEFVALAARAGGDGWSWSAGSPFEEDDADLPRLSAPGPPKPTGPVVLSRLGVGGGTDHLTVDRIVSEIDESDGVLTITYHPTGPIGTLEDDGRSVRYDYPLERIEVDVRDGYPTSIAVGEHESTALPLEDWGAFDPAPVTATPFDLSGVDGVDWRLREQDPAVIAKSVEAIRSALAALPEPDLMWLRSDDRWHRVESAYTDVDVRVSGSWPVTRVVATFRYRPRGRLHFRYSVPVFDGAGRPLVHEYLTVYLMEELDTLDPADLRRGTDGFVDLDF